MTTNGIRAKPSTHALVRAQTSTARSPWNTEILRITMGKSHITSRQPTTDASGAAHAGQAKCGAANQTPAVRAGQTMHTRSTVAADRVTDGGRP
jgi:hypothetical protein